MIKLNLGCFNKKIYGFVNVDIRKDVNPDVVDDIFTLDTFEYNSVDLIYACHCLEHLDHKNSLLALKRWYDVLKSGGIVRIAVPDMERIFAHYIYYRDLKYAYSALWGSQRHEYDYHKHGWDFSTLQEDLDKTGFKNICRYNWREKEHSYVDDYSQAYVPHMDKENGMLMSLNVEATKK
jgi:predicted SAM-dependent methyltransferase